MSGIVVELQREALDSSIPLNDVLRKALVVANKLEITDFRRWIENELDGYSKPEEIPKYREVRGTLMAFNPYNGWIPLMVHDAKVADSLSIRKISQSVAGLLACIANSKDNTLVFSFAPEIERLLMDEDGFRPGFHVGVNSIHGIIDRVRTTIVEWSIRLEQQGILGENMTFSREEKKRAEGNQNISIQSFQGILGDVAGSSVTQHLGMNVRQGDFESVNRFLTENGVLDDDLRELRVAIESDPKPEAEGRFGPKVSGWIGKMMGKASSGVWKIGIAAAGAVIARAIAGYYGF